MSKLDVTELGTADGNRLAAHAPIAVPADDHGGHADHRVLYVLGFGIIGAIATNAFVFTYFVLFYASG